MGNFLSCCEGDNSREIIQVRHAAPAPITKAFETRHLSQPSALQHSALRAAHAAEPEPSVGSRLSSISGPVRVADPVGEAAAADVAAPTHRPLPQRNSYAPTVDNSFLPKKDSSSYAPTADKSYLPNDKSYLPKDNSNSYVPQADTGRGAAAVPLVSPRPRSGNLDSSSPAAFAEFKPLGSGLGVNSAFSHSPASPFARAPKTKSQIGAAAPGGQVYPGARGSSRTQSCYADENVKMNPMVDHAQLLQRGRTQSSFDANDYYEVKAQPVSKQVPGGTGISLQNNGSFSRPAVAVSTA